MTPTEKLNLIRSVLGHATGRDPTDVTDEIRAILNGTDLTTIHHNRTRKENTKWPGSELTTRSLSTQKPSSAPTLQSELGHSRERGPASN